MSKKSIQAKVEFTLEMIENILRVYLPELKSKLIKITLDA